MLAKIKISGFQQDLKAESAFADANAQDWHSELVQVGKTANSDEESESLENQRQKEQEK